MVALPDETGFRLTGHSPHLRVGLNFMGFNGPKLKDYYTTLGELAEKAGVTVEQFVEQILPDVQKFASGEATEAATTRLLELHHGHKGLLDLTRKLSADTANVTEMLTGAQQAYTAVLGATNPVITSLATNQFTRPAAHQLAAATEEKLALYGEALKNGVSGIGALIGSDLGVFGKITGQIPTVLGMAGVLGDPNASFWEKLGAGLGLFKEVQGMFSGEGDGGGGGEKVADLPDLPDQPNLSDLGLSPSTEVGDLAGLPADRGDYDIPSTGSGDDGSPSAGWGDDGPPTTGWNGDGSPSGGVDWSSGLGDSATGAGGSDLASGLGGSADPGGTGGGFGSEYGYDSAANSGLGSADPSWDSLLGDSTGGSALGEDLLADGGGGGGDLGGGGGGGEVQGARWENGQWVDADGNPITVDPVTGEPLGEGQPGAVVGMGGRDDVVLTSLDGDSVGMGPRDAATDALYSA